MVGVVLLFLIIISGTEGNPIYIDVDADVEIEDGSIQNPYSTIQKGIDNATANDNIIIRAGNYRQFRINGLRSLQIYPYGYYNDSLESVTVFIPRHNRSIFIHNSTNIFIHGLNILAENAYNGRGVYINASNNISISNISISHHHFDGVQIRASDSIKISNSRFYDCAKAIKILTYNSSSITIDNNTISDSTNGIKLFHTQGVIVNNNSIFQCYRGIYIDESYNNVITNNEFYNNSHSGVTILNNSYNNSVFNNQFVNNGDHNSQGIDHGVNNSWDDGAYGNWWSDYSGIDIDGNGIGDEPYHINSSYNVADRYPLMDTTNIFTVTLFINPNPSVQGQLVDIILSIEQDVDWVSMRVYLHIDGDLHDSFMTDLNGTIIHHFTWKASSKGTHEIRVTMEGVVTEEVNRTIEVRPSTSDSSTSIPDYAYFILAATTVFLATYRRRSF